VSEKAHGVHAAADIDSHRRGDDRAPRRDDRAHRRADPGVHVGHRATCRNTIGSCATVSRAAARHGLEVVGEYLTGDATAFDDLSDGHWWHSTGARRAERGAVNI